jgi:hypothetical protein
VAPDSVAKLIEWATGGLPVPDVSAMISQWGGGGTGTTTEILRMPSSEVVPEGVSLRQFAADQGLDLPRLRRWSERKGFPVEVAVGANRTKLYDRDHLRDWTREFLRSDAIAEVE